MTLTLTMKGHLLTEDTLEESPYGLCCKKFSEGIPPTRLRDPQFLFF